MEADHFTNLRLERSEVDAWKPRARWDRLADDRVALSLASIASVALMLYGAARRRSDRGTWWFVGGAVLGCAAASLGANQWLRDTRFRSEALPGDIVTRESMDSFPASDAPSSNATTAAPPPLGSDFRTD